MSQEANRVLAGLPKPEYESLQSDLQTVRLTSGRFIYGICSHIDEAYFINSGVASVLTAGTVGSMVQVAMAGSEGGVGLCMLLGGNRTPFCYIAQTPIIARRISLTTLRKEFDKNLVLRSCCSRFLHLLLAQIAQSGLCHRFHKTDQRLCRWLLVASDRLRATDLPVTQEALALMLGATRPNITTTLGVLQRRNLIECNRGRIILVERKRLESVACSCYSTAREYE